MDNFVQVDCADGTISLPIEDAQIIFGYATVASPQLSYDGSRDQLDFEIKKIIEVATS